MTFHVNHGRESGDGPTAFHVEQSANPQELLDQTRVFAPRGTSSTTLCLDLPSPDQEEPLERAGNWNWVLPPPPRYFPDPVDIAGANPQNGPVCGNTVGVGPSQKFIELP